MSSELFPEEFRSRVETITSRIAEFNSAKKKNEEAERVFAENERGLWHWQQEISSARKRILRQQLQLKHLKDQAVWYVQNWMEQLEGLEKTVPTLSPALIREIQEVSKDVVCREAELKTAQEGFKTIEDATEQGRSVLNSTREEFQKIQKEFERDGVDLESLHDGLLGLLPEATVHIQRWMSEVLQEA